MRTEFNKNVLDKLLKVKPEKQLTVWDTKATGLCVLVSPGRADRTEATVTFRVCYYLPVTPGKPYYISLGRWPDKHWAYKDDEGREQTLDCSNVDKVRKHANYIRTRAALGYDPKRPKLEGTVDVWVNLFLEQYASGKKSYAEIKRIFDVYVLPEWGPRKVEEITKSDVSALLHKVAASKMKLGKKRVGTPKVANAMLAQLSKFFTWYVANHGTDAYRSPVVRGMKIEKGKSPPRERYLSDPELRALWKACGELGTYGAAVKVALLTAQRFYKVGSDMRRSAIGSAVIPSHYLDDEFVPEMRIDDVWDAGSGDDPDNKLVSVVPLAPLARVVINAVPVVDVEDGADYVFSLNGTNPMQNWSDWKERLDQRMLEIMREQAEAAGEDPDAVHIRPWQQRDLRRTARTLMPRAGVNRAIAEHALAHKLPRIEGTYDRHAYIKEKRDAFDQLARLIERIVDLPPARKILHLPTRTGT